MSPPYMRLVDPPPPIIVVPRTEHSPMTVSLSDNQWNELQRLALAPQPPSGAMKRHVQKILVEKGLAWPSVLTGLCTISDNGRRRIRIGRACIGTSQ